VGQKTRTFAFFWQKFFSKITYKEYFHARKRESISRIKIPLIGDLNKIFKIFHQKTQKYGFFGICVCEKLNKEKSQIIR
jgi:hypothetical protein